MSIIGHRELTTDERREWDSYIKESELNFAPRDFCKYCGADLPDNAKLCLACGAHIKGERDCLRPDPEDIERMGVAAGA